MVFSKEVNEVLSTMAATRLKGPSKKERSRAKRLLKEPSSQKMEVSDRSRREKTRRERRSYLTEDQRLCKEAVIRHSRTLQKLLQGSKWAARDAGMVKVVARLIQEISTLKAKYEKPKKTVRVRSKSKVPIDRAAVMYLNPRHHTHRVHITKEQRAINKVKDGIVSARPEVSNATHFLPDGVDLPSNVVSITGGNCGRVVRTSLNVPVRNATPKTRNERMKYLGPWLKGLRKTKYPPYSRVQENILKAA